MSDDIQRNENIKGGQNAQTVQGNQIQVNNTKNYFYASISSKALKDYDKDIFVQSGVLAKQTKKALILLIFFSMVSSLAYYKNRANLKIENDKLTLFLKWKKELKIIEYKNIRGYLIEKNS